MNLPQTTLDRIEKEAFGMMRSLRDEDFLNYDTAVEMIKAEALRALPLYEALKKIRDYYSPIQAICDIADAAIASYESGEPVQGIEARQKDPNPLAREALKTELWNMLGDDCEKSLSPIKETWLDSMMADIDSYCDGREGKEAKEFAEWISQNYLLARDAASKEMRWFRNGTANAETTEELYSEWQQSLNQQL